MSKRPDSFSVLLGRVFAGTAASAISFTILSMALTSPAQPEVVAAAVQPSLTPVVVQKVSIASTETEAPARKATGPTTSASVQPATASTALTEKTVTPEPFSTLDPAPPVAVSSSPAAPPVAAAPVATAAASTAPPAKPAAPVVEPPAAESAGDWMTDLMPRVDPNGLATWVFERNGGWGASNGHTVYIDPNVPTDKRFSVMAHEYSHILQARVFGSLRNSKAALSAIIGSGPSDIAANESTADCMALMQGATWTDYGCQNQLRPAAAAILAGRRP